jgi:hypothetical protein
MRTRLFTEDNEAVPLMSDLPDNETDEPLIANDRNY